MDLLIFNLNVALMVVGFGIFVLSKQDKKAAHYALAAVCFAAGCWLFLVGVCASGVVHSAPLLLLAARTMYFIGFLVIVCFCFFTQVFPPNQSSFKAWQAAFLAGPVVLLTVFLFFTNLIISAVHPELGIAQRMEFRFAGNLVYSFFMLLNSFWSLMGLRAKYRKAVGAEKKQILYIAWGFSLTFGTALLTDVLGPLYGNFSLVIFSPLMALPFLAAAYLVLKYRFLEMDLVFRKALFYSLIMALTISVFALVFWMLPLMGPPGGPQFKLVTFLTAALLMVATLELKGWLENLAGRLSGSRLVEYYQSLENFPKKMNQVAYRQELLEILRGFFMETVNVRFYGIYFEEERKPEKVFALQDDAGLSGLSKELALDHPLIRYLSSVSAPIETGEFHFHYGHLYSGARPADPIKAALHAALSRDLKAELALPLASQNHLAGVLLLGEKRSGERFTRRELELLETIGHHLATLFENIRLYEKTLQDEYMTMVSTIISNLVHELHNPLTSVKTMVGMLETRANHPEFVKRFMEIVPAEITRVLDITQKLVLYALPVMQEKPEMLRVSELAEKALALMKDKLKESQVAVTTTFADLPEIRGEAKQLIQMFLNLILNACQASKLGGRIDLFCGRSDTWPDAIVIRVKDAGAGIKTLDLPHLFKPFFSTKIYGLGLGLSICKKIVESHKGMIALESREGQGTTVTVTLPVHT